MSDEDRICEEFMDLNSNEEPKFEVIPCISQMEERHDRTVNTDFANAEEIAALEANDTDPLPTPQDRKGYTGDRHYEYWITGAQLAAKIQKASVHYARREVYAEIGAASGRAVRHLAPQEAFKEIWAFDINWRHIV